MVEQIPAKNDVMIFKIVVDVLDASNSKEFKAEIVPLLDANPKAVFDMSLVTFIDSSGLGQMVASFTAVRNQDGHLKLLSLTRRIKDLMQITKLLTVFDVFDDETKALKSFR